LPLCLLFYLGVVLDVFLNGCWGSTTSFFVCGPGPYIISLFFVSWLPFTLGVWTVAPLAGTTLGVLLFHYRVDQLDFFYCGVPIFLSHTISRVLVVIGLGDNPSKVRPPFSNISQMSCGEASFLSVHRRFKLARLGHRSFSC